MSKKFLSPLEELSDTLGDLAELERATASGNVEPSKIMHLQFDHSANDRDDEERSPCAREPYGDRERHELKEGVHRIA